MERVVGRSSYREYFFYFFFIVEYGRAGDDLCGGLVVICALVG